MLVISLCLRICTGRLFSLFMWSLACLLVSIQWHSFHYFSIFLELSQRLCHDVMRAPMTYRDIYILHLALRYIMIVIEIQFGLYTNGDLSITYVYNTDICWIVFFFWLMLDCIVVICVCNVLLWNCVLVLKYRECQLWEWRSSLLSTSIFASITIVLGCIEEINMIILKEKLEFPDV